MSAHDALFARSGTGPLSGLVVADFSRVLAGPYCTMMLADMGATVIKVEGPSGDDTRHWQPPTFEADSTYYLSINRNKHSIVLDFEDEADLRTARELAGRCDILVENFKPDGLVRFGLDFDSVAATNPGVLYASITGFGTAGGAGLPGYDLLVQAMSGLMSLTGDTDGSPYRSGVAVFDVITGLHACTGLLAALNHRTNTGQGQHLELNLMSSALSGMVNQSAAYAIAGVVPNRMGNEHPSIYPYEPIPTGDGLLVFAIGNDGQFARLCDALLIPGTATDPRFAKAVQRGHHRTELRPILIRALSTQSAQHWFEQLSALGIPCGPILDVAGGIELAAQLGLEPVVTAGGLPTVGNPIRFSHTPVTYDLAPPALDNAGADVRKWLHETAKLHETTRE